jgi:hypothetical protein
MDYATVTDFKAYSTLYKDLADAEVTTLLKAATRDIDATVGSTNERQEDGRRFDPMTLSTVDAGVLSRATCAQAEYRKEMGERFFIRPQHAEVSGPDYGTKGKLQRIGPRVWDELAGSGILRLSTQWAGSDTHTPPWRDFAVG